MAKTVTRTTGTRKTVVRKDPPADPAQGAAAPRGARTRRGVPPGARTAPAQETTEEARRNADVSAESQAVPGAVDVIAEAQRQAADQSTAFFATNPSLGGMVDAREELRGKYNAVKGLPQYAREEALFKAQLDELDAKIAGRA